MASINSRTSAEIIAFPARGRFAAHDQVQRFTPQAQSFAVCDAIDPCWYHTEAIEGNDVSRDPRRPH
ncbi:DUF2735 domain-containing protein [Oryzibacter oryziterrae]|uniref:DUF2735 domain-containing protein n=1 Tax=Oryzibacter oryziterrae TaxID=2766474 RepID=UPI001F2F5A92|nr:DUF2735 domain-containing protein [Oryzibacter oryziterrae]